MELHNQIESSSFPFELQSSVPSLTSHKNEVEGDRNSQLENSPKEEFQKERRVEIDNASDIRSQHPFPLARIRRIAKSNGKVERIGADATVLLAKACEFFVMELTSQAWFNKQENKRLTLRHWDIGRALGRNNHMQFLAHIIPASSQKPEELNVSKETDPRHGNQVHSMYMNSAFLMGNQEIPQPFLPSISSVHLNYHPGYKAFLTGNQEIPQPFLPSISSVPLNCHPGYKAFLMGNQEIPQLFLPSISSGPLNSHPGYKEEPPKRSN